MIKLEARVLEEVEALLEVVLVEEVLEEVEALLEAIAELEEIVELLELLEEVEVLLEEVLVEVMVWLLANGKLANRSRTATKQRAVVRI